LRAGASSYPNPWTPDRHRVCVLYVSATSAHRAFLPGGCGRQI